GSEQEGSRPRHEGTRERSRKWLIQTHYSILQIQETPRLRRDISKIRSAACRTSATSIMPNPKRAVLALILVAPVAAPRLIGYAPQTKDVHFNQRAWGPTPTRSTSPVQAPTLGVGVPLRGTSLRRLGRAAGAFPLTV